MSKIAHTPWLGASGRRRLPACSAASRAPGPQPLHAPERVCQSLLQRLTHRDSGSEHSGGVLQRPSAPRQVDAPSLAVHLSCSTGRMFRMADEHTGATVDLIVRTSEIVS